MALISYGRFRHPGDPAQETVLGLLRDGDLADATVVDLHPGEVAAATASAVVRVWHRPATGEVVELAVRGLPGREAPPLWFVLLREEAASVLLALELDVLPPGSVLDRAGFTALRLRNADQLGALRWWTGSGVVDQVYVDPAHRRRHVGTAMTHAAACLQACWGGPRLRADGVRTDDGERWLGAAPAHWAPRVPARTEHAPGMTPPG